MGELHDMITIGYDTTEEFNVDLKAECGQLNVAHVEKKIIKKEPKTNANGHAVQYRFKIREGTLEKIIERLWRKGFVKEMSFKSGVKGHRSDRW